MVPATLQEAYRKGDPFRRRGLISLERRVGGVESEIRCLLDRRDRIRILEIGCGFGTAMLEISQKYGDQVSLVGINRNRRDGNAAMLAYNAMMSDVPDEVLSSIEIRFADVSKRIPCKSRRFDLVFSQVCWLFIPDKVGALLEVGRVLNKGGVGIIQFMFYPKKNDAYGPDLLEIRRNGREIDPIEFLRKSKGLTLNKIGRAHVAVVGCDFNLPAPLRLIDQIDLRKHRKSLVGVRSIYEVED